MIPPRLIRTVPAETAPEIESLWAHATELHPGWDHITWRDPIDPAAFPISAPHWARCTSGAQRAGLIRLEALLDGGIYIDSDVELFRSLEPFRPLHAFAAWEDAWIIPDAVIGAEPGHSAIRRALELAIERIGEGAWVSGPGVSTEVFRADPTVFLFSPSVFYPYHYTEKERAAEDHGKNPWCYGAHHWAGSWLP